MCGSRDLAMSEPDRLAQRLLERALGDGAEGHLLGRVALAGLEQRADLLGRDDSELGVGAHHAEQQVLCADVVVVKLARLLLGEDDGFAGLFVEAFEHERSMARSATSLGCARTAGSRQRSTPRR